MLLTLTLVAVPACEGRPSGDASDAAIADAALADAAVVDAAPPDAALPDAAEPDALIQPHRIRATPSSLRLIEDEITPSQVSFSLDWLPCTDVLVDLTLSDPTKASLGTTQLRFTPANFATPQPVSILATSDDDARWEQLTLTAGSPGVVPAIVTVDIVDNDDQSLRVSPASATIVEGQSMTFQVRVSVRETRDISAMVDFDSPVELTASPNPIVIPWVTYPASVTLTVTALNDADALDDTHVMTVSSPGNAFSQTVSILVLDDD